MVRQPSILICDDDPGVRLTVGDFLAARGYAVETAESLSALRAALRTGRPDAIVLDYRLSDGISLDVLPEVKMVWPDTPVVMLTGHGSIDLAVIAVKAGADQFAVKPVDLDVLQTMLERLLDARRAQKRDAVSRTKATANSVDPFLGQSEPIQRLRREAERAASTDRPVLLAGETGSGKGVIARWLHASGRRADDPMVDLNCAAFARELIDSELFGHERGAFTGAVAAKQGLFELAHGGTLFLDEIGDMDIGLQAKLLKAVEEKKFRRVGDLRDRTSDIRLVSATHRNLAQQASRGEFRADLYFRISTIRLELPPLRVRAEDIPLLAEEFLRVLAVELGRPDARLDRKAMDALQRYAWPGNVRELRNVIERTLLLTDADVLSARDIRFDYDSRPEPAGGETLADAERAHVLRIVGEESGDVDRAAVRLGIARSTLYQKLKQYRAGAAEE